MAIQFYNTFSGKLEPFQPVDPAGKEVKLYTCGPTVYDYAHIGNYRTFIFEDLLRRFLEFKGYKVKHVMNITDVDDKTIAGANREKKKLEEFTKTYLDAFHEDLKTLNILPPTVEPHATHEIPAMLDLIQKLVDKKAGYVADGSVYYRVDSFKNYGKLSKKNLEKNIKGARVNVDEYDKEEGADFVLWKKSKEGEPSWDSPWGKGRPGWHIECSAMSMKYLGETFDIHAGGEDLIFPHHENEIAQSEAATGKPFVKYWLHAKHLLVDGKKMSKSAGNFYTLRDLLKMGHDPMAIRFILLSVHYRQQLNFTLEELAEAKKVIEKMDSCYAQCLSLLFLNGQDLNIDDKAVRDGFVDLSTWLPEQIQNMLKALENDLNVSRAFAFLSEVVKEINFRRYDIGKKHLQAAIQFFEKIDQLFGFDISIEKSIQGSALDKLNGVITFRNEQNYNEAGKLRDELQRDGWIVKDGRPGEPSILKKKRRAWDK